MRYLPNFRKKWSPTEVNTIPFVAKHSQLIKKKKKRKENELETSTSEHRLPGVGKPQQQSQNQVKDACKAKIGVLHRATPADLVRELRLILIIFMHIIRRAPESTERLTATPRSIVWIPAWPWMWSLIRNKHVRKHGNFMTDLWPSDL